MSTERFKEELLAAFPVSFRLHSPPITRNAGLDPQTYEIEALLEGKRWDQVEFDTIYKLREGLVFFTDSAFQYYLPAYMLAALTDSDRGRDIAMYLEFALTEFDHDYYGPRLRTLTTSQKRTVAEFMERRIQLIGEDGVMEDILVAYRKHWRPYAGTETAPQAPPPHDT